ncbi:MAG: hypothetical protein NTW25_02680 [Candidatus Kapabacteria bacterium]|nr:hypothetical protein [Candidatus Kapabacteria bacterium]
MYFDFHKKPIKSLKIFNLNKLIGTIHNYIYSKSTYIGISDFYVNLIIENILRSSDNLFYKIGDDNNNSFLVEKVKNTIISFKKNNITIESLDEELKMKF